MQANTTQCPRPGLEPGPLDLESSAQTMRPLSLPRKASGQQREKIQLNAYFMARILGDENMSCKAKST